MKPLVGISCCTKLFGLYGMPNHAASDTYVRATDQVVQAVPVAYALALHDAVGGLWREATPAMVRTTRRDAPRFAPDVEAIHPHFDEDFYVALHTDVQRAVSAGWMANGWEHFRNWGVHENRAPFRLDPVFYARRHPVAALEVGQGDFRNFHDHWVGVGRQRGYARMPA